ncbi:MAG: M23 family metallopeptidase [Synergistaceae bacterium]|jgi:murein DD-endopeptidase MepM/ murein hydrolase activator NlpD|nr:M23 family metallopeptidase [Synergistaceae bacterium]
MPQKYYVPLLFFVFAAFAQPTSASFAAENWQVILWKGDEQELERLCLERGIASADVFRINDPSPEAELSEEETSQERTLLIPNPKSAIFSTWMEVQSRKNNVPLVTVKLHGAPSSRRKSSPARASPERENIPSPIPSSEIPPPAPSGSFPVYSDISKPLVTGAEKPQAPKDGKANRVELLFPPVKPLVNIKLHEPPRSPSQLSGKFPAKMKWPVDGKISSGFGKRGKRSFHWGIDIPMPKGTPIFATLDGVVLETCTTKSKKYRGYGNSALIDHGNGIVTMYAHCDVVKVKKGQVIKQGDIVGLVGNTGRTTTHHLHFEVRKNGKAENPISYLAAR